MYIDNDAKQCGNIEHKIKILIFFLVTHNSFAIQKYVLYKLKKKIRPIFYFSLVLVNFLNSSTHKRHTNCRLCLKKINKKGFLFAKLNRKQQFEFNMQYNWNSESKTNETETTRFYETNYIKNIK